MAAVRSSDTGPERAVRAIVSRLGVRYRLNYRGVPGTPDLAITARKIGIWIHGCFWHRHRGCPRTRVPKTRVRFWKAKFDSNVARDRAAFEEARRLGWRVHVIWECELQTPELVEARLRALLDLEPMTAIELFTGAGGLALGLHQAGFALEMVAEADPTAAETLVVNINRGLLPVRDPCGIGALVEELALDRWRGRVDLIAAGIPCQPFSQAGRRQGHRDPRDGFPAFLKAVGTVLPRAFILENVSGIRNGAMEQHLSLLEDLLSHPACAEPEALWGRETRGSCGGCGLGRTYRVRRIELDAADFGVGQRRVRVFLVGFRADVNCSWRPPMPSHSKEALTWAQWGDGRYWDRHGIPKPKSSHPADAVLQEISASCSRLRPWRTVRDEIADLPLPNDPHAPELHKRIPGARVYPGHSGSLIDLPAKSLKAGVHGIPGGENMLRHRNGKVRYFTLREAARLQGFPDEWGFAGSRSSIVRQIGNAVAVPVGRALAETVLLALYPSRWARGTGG